MACFWCSISGDTLGDAIGICRRCGRFACRVHGYYDESLGEFICKQCVRNLLVESAIVMENLDDIKKETIREVGNFISEGLEGTYRSVEDFYQRAPQFLDMFGMDIDASSLSFEDWDSGELRRIFEDFGEESLRLLTAAAVISSATESIEELRENNEVLLYNLRKSLQIRDYA